MRLLPCAPGAMSCTRSWRGWRQTCFTLPTPAAARWGPRCIRRMAGARAGSPARAAMRTTGCRRTTAHPPSRPRQPSLPIPRRYPCIEPFLAACAAGSSAAWTVVNLLPGPCLPGRRGRGGAAIVAGAAAHLWRRAGGCAAPARCAHARGPPQYAVHPAGLHRRPPGAARLFHSPLPNLFFTLCLPGQEILKSVNLFLM